MTEPSFIIPQIIVIVGVFSALVYLDHKKADVKTTAQIMNDIERVKTEKSDKDEIQRQLDRIEKALDRLIERFDAHIERGQG